MKNHQVADSERPLNRLAAGRRGPSARSSSAPYASRTGLGAAPEDWKRDDHWTAIAAYVAEMYVPNEG